MESGSLHDEETVIIHTMIGKIKLIAVPGAVVDVVRVIDQTKALNMLQSCAVVLEVVEHAQNSTVLIQRGIWLHTDVL